jgi:HAD superfamily hydrolase (TIGR01484 family)
MKRLRELPAEAARHLQGLIFDLDGTLLTDGRLSLEAYDALHQLGAAGLRLVACTGRPAGWGEVIARQWPIALAVTENGAVSFRRDGVGIVAIDRVPPTERDERRQRLVAVADELTRQFPDVELADDNRARLTDVTFDIGERRQVPPEQVVALGRAAAALGARTFQSSIHLHVTFDTDDKASGTLFALSAAHGVEPSAALSRYAFVGDSANDEACFNAFRTTFGVANIADHLGGLTQGPKLISQASWGAGFAEIAATLVALRAKS